MNAQLSTPSASALAEHIVDTHHALLRRELPRVQRALPPGSALRRAWDELVGFLDQHMMKEEQILFPQIGVLERTGSVGCLAGAMMQMNYEHVVITAIEQRVRQLAQTSELREDIEFVLDDLAIHACLEDDELFPLVRELAGIEAP